MKNSFFLVIPEQQKRSERLRSFDELPLKQWISELPTANPGLATRLIHDLIEEFNRIVMDPQFRLEALEILRPSFLLIGDFLRANLIKTGFPKNANEQKIYDLHCAIEKEITIGYWIVVRELTSRDIGWFKSKHAALAIQRVIKGLSTIVITHYLMFLPVPEWVWMDLHSLYKLGLNTKKHIVKVPDATCLFNKTSTIADSYKQILLLSLANPAGMMQKEILQTYFFMDRILTLVNIEKQPVLGRMDQCIVLQDEDEAPIWFEVGEERSGSAVIFLNFNKLDKAFKQKTKFVNESEARFSSIHPGSENFERLPAELIDYLQLMWSGANLEGAVFFSDRMDRYFCIGLNLTYFLLTTLDSEENTDYEYIAESSSNSSLTCQTLKSGVLSIGSLVSFRKKDLPAHKRSLGVVTKISMKKSDGKLDFEVNAIAMQVHAVNYLRLDARKLDEPQKALIFSGKKGGAEKSYLIIESFVYKNDDVIRLFMNSENFPIILRDRKNIGLGYWQFECRRIEEKEIEKVKKGYDFI